MNQERFPQDADKLFVRQTVVLDANATEALTPPYQYKDGTPAEVLYGHLVQGTIGSLKVVLSAQNVPVTDDAGIPAEVVLRESPPEIADLNLTGITIHDRSPQWAPKVIDTSGASHTVEIVWVLRRRRRA